MFLGGRKMFLRRRSMRPGSIKITPTRDTINNQLSNCSCYGNTLWLTVTFGRVNIVCHPLVIIDRMYVKPFPFDPFHGQINERVKLKSRQTSTGDREWARKEGRQEDRKGSARGWESTSVYLPSQFSPAFKTSTSK